MSIRIGILGAAEIAPTAIIEPAKQIDGVQVVAIAARDEDRAAQFAAQHGIPRVLPDYQALIDDPEIDLVYIPTPPSLHGAWTKRAIEAGKAVLVEKPFTANAKEAAEVAKLARQHAVPVFEAMHSLYHPLWQQTKDAITGGEIGEVKEASAVFNYPIVDPGDIRWDGELAGGALMDLGIYPLTLLRFLFPDLELVSASADTKGIVDASFEGRYRTRGGATVALFASMEPGIAEEQTLVVRGSDGSLTLDMFVKPQFGGSLTVAGKDGTREVVAEGPSTYARMLQAVARALEDGTTLPTNSTAAVGTMEAVDELYEAAGLPVREPSAP